MKPALTAALLGGACALAACQNNNAATTNDLNAMTNAGAADGNATDTAAATQVDSDFITSSIKGDTAEIATGQLAASKGATAGVRDFGNTLVTDHGAHKQKLIDLANSAGIAVPTEPAESGQDQLEKLQTLSGAEFDKTFLQMMIANHHKGIAKNEKEAQGTGPAAQLAAQSVPVLKKHLSIAESLAK